MPQMAPMMWLVLFIAFILSFILMVIMNYYNTNISFPYNQSHLLPRSYCINWKW
uniref:ATP synthase F0 subunit 8 n=1 Tax=Vescelia pieli TaxID=2526987 RepID=UPI0030E51580